MSSLSIIEIWLMAFVTIAIFSFLYKDNPIYRMVENIFAGMSAGYYIGLVWESVIIQQLYDPLSAADAHWTKWLLLIPALLGVLMFSRLVPKYSWLSRIALSFVMGCTAGVFIISQLQGLVLPQTQSTMIPQPVGGPTDFILTGIIVAGVISTLIYFYFSKAHTGALGVTAKVGIWFIMIAFGAHFGYTVMGRVSLLIGRVQFLIDDWIGSFL
ncbi:MAG: hypothetical protein V3T31_02030 [candidate division Zixibacteria bacterium]